MYKRSVTAMKKAASPITMSRLRTIAARSSSKTLRSLHSTALHKSQLNAQVILSRTSKKPVTEMAARPIT